ncbi:MAG: hypothetical protein WAU60_09655 [Candidatus Competibacter denitrificans]
MSKRPSVDLKALTAEQAAPMPEASQRMAPPPVGSVKTANLEPMAFKVPPEFRKRFRQRALNADLKLNELLFAALAAWEEKNGIH